MKISPINVNYPQQRTNNAQKAQKPNVPKANNSPSFGRILASKEILESDVLKKIYNVLSNTTQFLNLRSDHRRILRVMKDPNNAEQIMLGMRQKGSFYPLPDNFEQYEYYGYLHQHMDGDTMSNVLGRIRTYSFATPYKVSPGFSEGVRHLLDPDVPMERKLVGKAREFNLEKLSRDVAFVDAAKINDESLIY